MTFHPVLIVVSIAVVLKMATVEVRSNTEPANAGLFSGSIVARPELRGKHPRLFVSERELQSAINRCQTDDTWRKHYFRPRGVELGTVPRPVDLRDRSLPCTVLGKLAVAYALSGDSVYLERLRAWLTFMQGSSPVTIRSIGSRDNADLFCGQMLTGLAISYDVLKGRVPAEVENALRDHLVSQARQTWADLIAIRHYPYEQNHFSIPVGGLLVASLALLDEEADASAWGIWSSNALRRCLEALSPDGWFFEGMNYWGYTMQFPVTAAYALQHVTGVSLFEIPSLKNSPSYLAHNFLPNPDFVFDFADWGPRVNQDGTTAQRGYDRPWHTHPTTIPTFIPSLLNRARSHPLLDAFLEGRRTSDVGLNGIIGSLLQLPAVQKGRTSADLSPYPPCHYFEDMGVIHWRENWSDSGATAIAFKSGPPGGHAMTSLLRQFPDWKPSLGHAHPDAGSFILFSKGVFLANDTGYAVKKTAWHNSILVNGAGQVEEGTAFLTFKNVPYEKLNRIRMENVWLGRRIIAGTANFAAAYDDALGLTEMRRHLVMIDGRYLVILDRMGASSPHEYEWRLHSDQAAVKDDQGRFVMTNGPGRLVIKNLLPVASAGVSPTIVETELFEFKTRSRPQQRGHHLALKSPRTARARFLVAMNIQSSDADSRNFHAREVFDGKTELSDAAGSCTVWIGNSAELRGSFAYVLRDPRGVAISAGLHGAELKTPDVSITRKSEIGAVTLDLDPDVGSWSIEDMNTHAGSATFPASIAPESGAVLQINGRRQTIVMPKP
ncbi:heparinase [Opitutaceae bacterium TAV5]|nr:heparinase [Opitutaceae bacterium TAV5]